MNEKLYSIQLEQSVLSSLMTAVDGASGLDEQIGVLSPSDFYAAQHNLIFKHLKKLHSVGGGHDAVMVWDSIKLDANDSKMVSEKFIIDLITDSPSSITMIGQHTKRLIEHARRRALFAAGERIRVIAVDTTQFDLDGAISASEGVLGEIDLSESEDTSEDAFNLSIDLYKSINDRMEDRKNGVEKINGVKTGFRDLDEKIGVMGRGQLIIIAARPSMGKTALAQDIMLNVSFYQQHPVLFQSAEMPKEDIIARLVSSMSDITVKDIKSANVKDEQWRGFTKATDMLQKSKLVIDDKSAPTISHIRNNCRKMKAKYGYVGAVFIDYLTLLTSPLKTDQNYLAVGAISKALSGLAKEFNCPVFCLSQLSRKVDDRKDNRPVMSDLRESGQIEQDANVILFIYRDEIYNKNSKDAGVAEIIAAKVRDGEIGTVRLATELQYSRFVDLDMNHYHQSLESR